MTDERGHKDRLGAGAHSEEMFIEGVRLNCYLNFNPESNRVEIVRIMPKGVPDEPVREFSDEESAWAWARAQARSKRLP